MKSGQQQRQKDTHRDVVNHKWLADKRIGGEDMLLRIISVMPFEAFETITGCKSLTNTVNKTVSSIPFKLSEELTKSMLTFTDKLVLCVFLSWNQIWLLGRRQRRAWGGIVEARNSQQLKQSKATQAPLWIPSCWTDVRMDCQKQLKESLEGEMGLYCCGSKCT